MQGIGSAGQLAAGAAPLSQAESGRHWPVQARVVQFPLASQWHEESVAGSQQTTFASAWAQPTLAQSSWQRWPVGQSVSAAQPLWTLRPVHTPPPPAPTQGAVVVGSQPGTSSDVETAQYMSEGQSASVVQFATAATHSHG